MSTLPGEVQWVLGPANFGTTCEFSGDRVARVLTLQQFGDQDELGRFIASISPTPYGGSAVIDADGWGRTITSTVLITIEPRSTFSNDTIRSLVMLAASRLDDG
jgi:hypothetical protein